MDQLRWICTCGGLLDMYGPVVDPIPSATDVPGDVPADVPSWMGRYRAALPALPLPPPGPAEGTPAGSGRTATTLRRLGPSLWLKQDFELPTGSFKARGAAVMISLAATLGVPRVVVDSSGNAGKAVAAYGAQAGLATEVYVPEGTDAAKIASIESYGATVVEVPGGRQATARAAQVRLGEESSAWYASHVYQPSFHHGVKTLAYEIYEQLAPTRAATVVVPAGNGTLVLGLWLGFRDLQAAGRLDSVPRIVAVQAERCAPLAGLARSGPTMATGIDVSGPPRAGQVRAAVLASQGWVATVTETEIARGQDALADLGIGVEPTAAVAWAGWAGGAGGTGSSRWAPQREGEAVVLLVTGR